MKSEEDIKRWLEEENRVFCSLVDPKRIHDAMIVIRTLRKVLEMPVELQGYEP